MNAGGDGTLLDSTLLDSTLLDSTLLDSTLLDSTLLDMLPGCPPSSAYQRVLPTTRSRPATTCRAIHLPATNLVGNKPRRQRLSGR